VWQGAGSRGRGARNHREGEIHMKFWVDMRLATDAGETIKRRRCYGDMSPEDFENLCKEMGECLTDLAMTCEIEEDRTQVGVGGIAGSL